MSLSQEEKEQVAVLLGWTYYPATEHGPHALWHTTNPNRIVYESEGSPVTLEACMEYAKGKGWGWSWTFKPKGWVESANGERVLQKDHHIVTVVRYQTLEAEPLEAFVRALLKAEEAAK